MKPQRNVADSSNGEGVDPSSGKVSPSDTTVLFVGPLPDPITGQALACKVFLEELLATLPG